MEFLKGQKTRSQHWIFIRAPGGDLWLMQKAWTSLGTIDPYQLLASPPQLRFEALLELSELASKTGWHRTRKAKAGARNQGKRNEIS